MSLYKIQSELKAPKGQENKFGHYKYRSCEDIVEAVKPILLKHKTSLIITDEIVLIGDRYYVKATAKLVGENIQTEATAFAREPLTKKGMDEAQLTGATSSYARKYALNGLFAIDDTKDADTMDNKDKPHIPTKSEKYAQFKAILKKASIEEINFMEYLKMKGVTLGVIIDRFITDIKVQNTHLQECENFLMKDVT